jgi:hypothetical protein
MSSVKFDSIEKFERIEFDEFEKLHFKNIQVADNNKYLYMLTDLEAVHNDLKDFLHYDIQALYDSYELHTLMDKFQFEALEALTEMIAQNGVEQYGLKVWEGGKFRKIIE